MSRDQIGMQYIIAKKRLDKCMFCSMFVCLCVNGRERECNEIICNMLEICFQIIECGWIDILWFLGAN